MSKLEIRTGMDYGLFLRQAWSICGTNFLAAPSTEAIVISNANDEITKTDWSYGHPRQSHSKCVGSRENKTCGIACDRRKIVILSGKYCLKSFARNICWKFSLAIVKPRK